MRNVFLAFIMIHTHCFSCPADSILCKTSKWFATGLIRNYQGYSSQVPFEMCVFEPTCSNFALQAIDQYGLLKAIPITANRLIRCNPSRKYEKNSNYVPIGNKLFDPPESYMKNSNTFSMSFIVPGVYQIQKGKCFDGFLAFSFTTLPIYGLINQKFKLNLGSILFLFLEVSFYSGHINYCYTIPD